MEKWEGLYKVENEVLPEGKVYIIAEIGINHLGSLTLAKKLIALASVAGCDAVKFQKRTPEVCVPKDQWEVQRDTPIGKMSYIDYRKLVEFEKPEYDEINEFCKLHNIKWSASVWDLPSLEFMQQYDVPFIKIPSAMLTNHELLAATCKTGKKVIMSTGMSTLKEIQDAVAVLRENSPNKTNTLDTKQYRTETSRHFALLHCNSTYPAKIDDLNLAFIPKLKEMFDCEVGYSGHEFRLGTSVAAVYLGASIIERHITIDRTLWGTDQMASVEPQGLIKLVRGVRELEQAYGQSMKVLTEDEKKVRLKLRGY